MVRYTVVATPEDGMFVVRVPALPGGFTQGTTSEQALSRGGEAIAGHVAAVRDLGEPIPIPVADGPSLLAIVEVDPAA